MLNNAVKRARAARHDQSGFTLIELLIVIVILGILAAIVVFSVKGITNKADVNACQTEVSTVDTAEEAAFAQNGAYDATMTALVADGFIHAVPKYIASYDTATNKVVLNGSAPGGCTAQ
jgi:general secretion pathway protein G